MRQHIARISLLVEDYDEAIAFYTEKLNFKLLEDTKLSPSKRWVLVAPTGDKQCALVLTVAVNDIQKELIGNQCGGSVFLFLYTDDIWEDYVQMRLKGVKFVSKPKTESYGTVAVFEDLYGNLWDLLEPVSKTEESKN